MTHKSVEAIRPVETRSDLEHILGLCQTGVIITEVMEWLDACIVEVDLPEQAVVELKVALESLAKAYEPVCEAVESKIGVEVSCD